eukprot:5992795-Prymnesium_polylepis.1
MTVRWLPAHEWSMLVRGERLSLHDRVLCSALAHTTERTHERSPASQLVRLGSRAGGWSPPAARSWGQERCPLFPNDCVPVPE